MKKKSIFLLFSLFTLVCVSQTIIGTVVGITDGDTFKLLENDTILHRIRVANIDCPERKQPFSKKAKEFTSNAIFNKKIKIEVLNSDRFGRLIAQVYYDSLILSAELVKNGYAWHYTKYSNDSTLIELENQARKFKRGLWQDKSAMPPWEWRKRKKK